ncbi:hypothetical protein KJ877_00225 [bacterium]|nr:hypothetical protein [bacterium]MBU1990309.1 hypothetical protein [bacterium]
MLHASDEKTYVATYKELVIAFLTFSVILFFLYPKDLLKEQILSEKSNYDLSMLYLKNMLANDPENESLMIALAELSLQSGKKDLSLRLLELLHGSKDTQIRHKAYLLSYRLAKEDYFFVEEKEQKEQILLKLRQVFSSIIQEKVYTTDELEQWYEEAMFLSEYTNAYMLLKERLSKNIKSIKLLEESYYFAERMHDEKDSLRFLHALQTTDIDRRYTWLIVEYRKMIKNKEYKNAEKFLQYHAKDSLKWVEELAMFYSFLREYVKASDEYITLYRQTKQYSSKVKYFMKAVEALQAGNKTREAVELAYTYEDNFFSDKTMRMYILKLYLASGDLKKASDLSKKILDKTSY